MLQSASHLNKKKNCRLLMLYIVITVRQINKEIKKD